MSANSAVKDILALIQQPGSQSNVTLLNALMECVQANRDHVVWLRPDSQIIYANHATCEKLGIDAKDIIGKFVWDWDPHFPKARWRSLWSEIQQKKEMTFNSEHKTQSGTVFPVEIHAHHFTNGDDEYLFAFARDLSEQKAFEHKTNAQLASSNTHLNEAQDLLRLIMDSNQDYIFAKDKHFRIIHANKKFLSLYPPEARDKVLGYTMFENCKDKGLDVFSQSDMAAFLEGKSEYLETIVFPNGKERLIETQKIRFHDRQHEPYILCVARDVTERELMIAELNKRTEELSTAVAAQHAVYDAILDCVIVIDERGIIEDVNTATTKLFGYAKGALIGQNVTCLMDQEDADEHDVHLSNHIKTGHANIVGKTREVLAKKRSGQLFYAQLSVAEYKQGDTIKFVGSLRDISEQVSTRRRLEFDALHDALTGLASRRLLEQRLESAISEALRNEFCFCIVFIDLDDFKPINDDLGHDVGDEFLKIVATRLKHGLKTNDLCARVGGDEFVVLTQPSKFNVDEMTLTGRITSNITSPITIGQHRLCVSASTGIATFPRDGESRDQLLRHADAVMYAEKRRKKRDE